MRLDISIAAALACVPFAHAITGKSYTSWDCCKPACAWSANLARGVQGSAKVCDINNNPLRDGLSATTGCSTGGVGYLCDTYSPIPVSDNLSYGFAIAGPTSSCCKCYQLTWTSGNARGKQMVVQAINSFGTPTGDLKANDLIILSPGGGSGPNDAGCRNQYGRIWGSSNGGVTSANDCANLPQNLQGGCYWRWNWAKGTVNTWNIDYQQVACPPRLTTISGCNA
ncbi:glycoside hydrolase [Naviculisporaceae sp. PSN 640]